MQVDLNSLWFQHMSSVMNILTTQHKAIAENIANVNTPGYSRQQVNFQDQLDQALHNEDAETTTEVPVERDLASTTRTDGNNVNVESEMVHLAQNTELFSFVSKIVNKNLSMARYVISGGTRS